MTLAHISLAPVFGFFGEFGFRLLMTAFYFFLGLVVEIWASADKGNTRRNVLFNVAHGIIFRALGILIGVGFAAKVTGLARYVPFAGFIHLGFSDHHKFWLSLPLAFMGLAIHDFFYYWYHRLQHSSRWLWAEHEFHHSDEHMNVTTGHNHLEHLLAPIFILLPMAVLFQLPTVTVLGALILVDAFDYSIHTNARIGLGRLNWILANPQVHRIHHSKLPQHIDKNFAARFPLWDVIFGTYYHPKPGEYPPTGLASGRTVHSLWEAAIMPFATWKKMLAAKPVSIKAEDDNRVAVVI